MPTILGTLRGSAPYVVGDVTLQGELIGRRGLLLDTGAIHTVLVIPIVVLYDARDPEDSYLHELPRGVLGLQNATFGRSRLVVDFGAEEVMLEFNEPPTPFRLG